MNQKLAAIWVRAEAASSAATPTALSDLDGWIRRRLRSAEAKQWFKSGKARFRPVRFIDDLTGP
jgi:hypothetical protein